MNYSVVFKMVSVLLAILSVAFGVCATAAFLGNNHADMEALPAWFSIIALTSMLAMAIYLPVRTAPKSLFRKEAMCIVGVGWFLAILIGALPYAMILQCSFVDAIFESASGLTTTGATVFAKVSTMPKSLLLWRALSQWIGGLGVVVFFVAILSFLGSGAKMLYSNEASVRANGASDAERIKSATRKIFAIYTGISILCLLSFRLCGMEWFDALCHMLSTVSTGGFSVFDNSIAHYHNNPLLKWVVIFFMFAGGISFFSMILLFKGKGTKFIANTELLTYLAILLVASLAVSTIILYDKDLTRITSWGEAITQGTFTCVSVMTSSGFSIENYQHWKPATHAILLTLMVIGGCAGSTSGGLKVSRAIGGIKLMTRGVERVLRPKVVRSVRVDGKKFDDEESESLLSFIAMYAVSILFGTILLGLLSPSTSLMGTLSATVCAISNVGPAFNEANPASTYAFMTPYAKMVLAFLMVLGRVEFYSILVLFMPSLWKKFQ